MDDICGVQLFEFGDRYRGEYDRSVEVVKSYYGSVSGFKDELLWAAMWLHRATDNEVYLNYAIDMAHSFGGIGWAMTEFSWDVKYAGIQVMASQVIQAQLSNQNPIHNGCICIHSSSCQFQVSTLSVKCF